MQAPAPPLPAEIRRMFDSSQNALPKNYSLFIGQWNSLTPAPRQPRFAFFESGVARKPEREASQYKCACHNVSVSTMIVYHGGNFQTSRSSNKMWECRGCAAKYSVHLEYLEGFKVGKEETMIYDSQEQFLKLGVKDRVV